MYRGPVFKFTPAFKLMERAIIKKEELAIIIIILIKVMKKAGHFREHHFYMGTSYVFVNTHSLTQQNKIK
jgi:type IV secretory pathway VirB3-like protein